MYIFELSQSDGVWLGDIGTVDYFSPFTRHQLKSRTVFGVELGWKPDWREVSHATSHFSFGHHPDIC